MASKSIITNIQIIIPQNNDFFVNWLCFSLIESDRCEIYCQQKNFLNLVTSRGLRFDYGKIIATLHKQGSSEVLKNNKYLAKFLVSEPWSLSPSNAFSEILHVLKKILKCDDMEPLNYNSFRKNSWPLPIEL